MPLSGSCLVWQTTAVEPILYQELSLISTRYQTMPSQWGCIFGRKRLVSRSGVWPLIGMANFVVTFSHLKMGLWSKCVQQYPKGEGLVESDEASFINEITRALKWKIPLIDPFTRDRTNISTNDSGFSRATLLHCGTVQILYQISVPRVPCKRKAALCKFLSVHMSGYRSV